MIIVNATCGSSSSFLFVGQLRAVRRLLSRYMGSSRRDRVRAKAFTLDYILYTQQRERRRKTRARPARYDLAKIAVALPYDGRAHETFKWLKLFKVEEAASARHHYTKLTERDYLCPSLLMFRSTTTTTVRHAGSQPSQRDNGRDLSLRRRGSSSTDQRWLLLL